MSERLQYQLAVFVDSSVFTTERQQAAAKARAIRHFLRTGESIEGVRIVARWRNPDRVQGEPWKTTEDAGQSLAEFWETMHRQRGALRRLGNRYP
jgi:hypothetical protein